MNQVTASKNKVSLILVKEQKNLIFKPIASKKQLYWSLDFTVNKLCIFGLFEKVSGSDLTEKASLIT